MDQGDHDLSNIDFIDSYRLISGAVVDLREVAPKLRAWLADLALRLYQGQGHDELLPRLDSDSPMFDGVSPLAPGADERPAVRVAKDIVYRAGVAEGKIAPQGGEDGGRPIPLIIGRSSAELRTPASLRGELTTEKIVTVGEAMNILGITRQAVINSVHAGKIRGEQHGRLWILARDDVLRYRETRARRRANRR